MPSKPSALPARRTPAPLRPIRPRRSAPISTAGAEASAQTDRPPIPSRSSTSQRYRSQAMRSRQSSSASRPRPPSRPPHRVPPQRLSRLHPPYPQPVFPSELRQRLLLRQPRHRHTEHRWRPAVSFPCPAREPISSPRHQLQPSLPSLPLARSLRGLQSWRRQRIRLHQHPTPRTVPSPQPHRLPWLQATQSPLRHRIQRQFQS
jgi:hypothetical protein